jgi:hypothetical protein
MDPFYIWILVAATVLGGIAGAFWAFRQPDPNPKGDEPQKTIGLQSAVLATVVAVLTVLFQLPSISIDLAIIFQYASDIVNLMMPIIGVGAGISFGFALVSYIIRLFRNIF